MPYGSFGKYGSLPYKGEMLARPEIPYSSPETITPASYATECIDIPFPGYDWFIQSCIIDNVLFQFEFQWSLRGQYWTMSVLDQNSNYIISGLKLSINYEMFSKYSNSNLPFGFMIPFNNKGSFDPINDGDLGLTVQLSYIPAKVVLENTLVQG